MTDDNSFVKQHKYQQGLAYENVLTNYISYIANLRVNDPKKYASSIETLILMCPKDIRVLCFDKMIDLGIERCSYLSMNADKMSKYDRLWEYINTVLEDKNMIFKTSYIKTYE